MNFRRLFEAAKKLFKDPTELESQTLHDNCCQFFWQHKGYIEEVMATDFESTLFSREKNDGLTLVTADRKHFLVWWDSDSGTGKILKVLLPRSTKKIIAAWEKLPGGSYSNKDFLKYKILVVSYSCGGGRYFKMPGASRQHPCGACWVCESDHLLEEIFEPIGLENVTRHQAIMLMKGHVDLDYSMPGPSNLDWYENNDFPRADDSWETLESLDEGFRGTVVDNEDTDDAERASAPLLEEYSRLTGFPYNIPRLTISDWDEMCLDNGETMEKAPKYLNEQVIERVPSLRDSIGELPQIVVSNWDDVVFNRGEDTEDTVPPSEVELVWGLPTIEEDPSEVDEMD